MRKFLLTFAVTALALMPMMLGRTADAAWTNPAPGTPAYQNNLPAATLAEVLEGWANFYGNPGIGIPHAVRWIQFYPSGDVHFGVNGICCGDIITVTTHPICTAPVNGVPVFANPYVDTGCSGDCPGSGCVPPPGGGPPGGPWIILTGGGSPGPGGGGTGGGSPATGDVVEVAVDTVTPGPNSLSFARSYSSLHHHAPTDLGIGWRSNFDREIRIDSTTEV